jgi:hypothetical protein
MRAITTLVLSGISPTAPASRARTRHGDSQALVWQARKRGPRAAPEARAPAACSSHQSCCSGSGACDDAVVLVLADAAVGTEFGLCK